MDSPAGVSRMPWLVQMGFQGVYLFHDGSGREVQLFCRFGKTAAVRRTNERRQQGIIHDYHLV